MPECASPWPRRAMTLLVPPLAWLFNLLLLSVLIVEDMSSIAHLSNIILCRDAVSCKLGVMCPLLEDEAVCES